MLNTIKSLIERTPGEVLLVENNAHLGKILYNVLGEEFKTIHFEKGLEGLAWIKNGNIPKVIVVDTNISDVDSREFLAFLSMNGLFNQIPILAIGSGDDFFNKDEVNQLGIAGYFHKPFDPLKVRQRIQQLVKQNDL